MSTPPCVGNILGTIKVDETTGINSENHINGTYSGAGETSWVAVALDAGRAVQFGFSGAGSLDAENIVVKAIYDQCDEEASPVATPDANLPTNFVNFTAPAYGTYYLLLEGSAAGTYHLGVSGDGIPHTGKIPEQIYVDETENINSRNHINGTYSEQNETSLIKVELDAERAVQFGFSGTGTLDAENIVIKAIYDDGWNQIEAPNSNFVTFAAPEYGTYYLLLQGSAAGTYHLGVSGDGTPHTGVAPTQNR